MWKSRAPALPKLRQVIKKANADPADFRRAYQPGKAPEHVHAHTAMNLIEAALKKRR